jgi:phosphate transport system substrate-binding protein
LKVAPARGKAYASPLDTEDVKSGKYPIARPLNQYTSGVPKGSVKDFIAFELSPEGQKIVEEEGFFPISVKDREFNKKSIGL